MARIDATTFAQRFPALGKALPGGEVDAVIGAVITEDFADGHTVVTDGEDSDALFLVWDGTLEVLITTADGEHSVATVGQGGVVGEVALLDPGPATATIRATGPATALRIDHDALDRMLQSSPAAAADLLAALNHTLAERVEASMDRLDAVLAGGDKAALIDVEHLLYTGEESG